LAVVAMRSASAAVLAALDAFGREFPSVIDAAPRPLSARPSQERAA
jgi:hypothetical protein